MSVQVVAESKLYSSHIFYYFGPGFIQGTSIKYKVERDKRYLHHWIHKVSVNRFMYTSNSKKRQKHELNHFKDNRNTILDLF